MSTAHALTKETQAAAVLREQLREVAGDDEDMIRDMIEGETSLHELISVLVLEVAHDDRLAAAAKLHADEIKKRGDRIKARAEIKRALIASAMEQGGLKRIETAAGTVTRKAVAPKVIISDESEIPTAYFDIPDPKLSTKRVGEALKARAKAMAEAAAIQDPEERAEAIALANQTYRDVPGASLSNGGETIQIVTR